MKPIGAEGSRRGCWCRVEEASIRVQNDVVTGRQTDLAAVDHEFGTRQDVAGSLLISVPEGSGDATRMNAARRMSGYTGGISPDGKFLVYSVGRSSSGRGPRHPGDRNRWLERNRSRRGPLGRFSSRAGPRTAKPRYYLHERPLRESGVMDDASNGQRRTEEELSPELIRPRCRQCPNPGVHSRWLDTCCGLR